MTIDPVYITWGVLLTVSFVVGAWLGKHQSEFPMGLIEDDEAGCPCCGMPGYVGMHDPCCLNDDVEIISCAEDSF